MKERVLVTAIGSFSADIVIKNIKKMQMFVVGCDIYPKEWVVDSKNVDRFYQAPKALDEENYVNFIINIVKNEKIRFIVPLTDVEVDVLNRNRDEIEREEVVICISNKNVIELCRDKMKLFTFLQEKHVVDTIPTYWLNSINVSDLKYPVVSKPVDGRSSEGLRYIACEEEMQIVSQLYEKRFKGYIIQPKIDGNIVTVDVVRCAIKKKSVILPRRELLRTKNGAGTTILTFCDKQLEKKCEILADVLGVKGCVNFEFIQGTDGHYYFLECNPRFSGGVEFSCMSGYDCVKNHINCFNNQEIDERRQYKSQYIARKYEEYVTGVMPQKECEK